MQNLTQMQENLILWYKQNGRKNLPWRNLVSKLFDERLKQIDRAYGVYISEIMLQQSSLKFVLERYYFPFLQKFPTLKSLALADEDELLKAWQGLGYYSRARNLKKAARLCFKNFGGVLPSKVKDLLSLNGVGAYSAGAIACFAYGEKVSFFDTNIKRVLARLFALQNPSSKELSARAEQILNKKDAFSHNQALIDLGALICLAKNPKCKLCPFYEFCKGKFTPELYPKTRKIEYENLKLNLVFLENKNKFAVQKSEKRLYKGLYNFVFFEDKKCENLELLGEFKHSYTKYKIKVKIYHKRLFKEDENFKFKSLEELENLALSALSLKALKFLI